MRLAERMIEKQLKAVTKTRACGGVPGLVVKVVKLKDGSLAKYFILRESTINRIFTLGRYPQMSLADAFKKAADWKVKILTRLKKKKRSRPHYGGNPLHPTIV